MALNMPSPWKHPKTGVYWVRRRVPANLRAIVGKTEERATLGTKDPIEAKRRYPVALAELDAKWANLAAGPRQISEVEALDLARPFYEQLFASFAENPSSQDHWDVDVGRGCFARPAPLALNGLTAFADVDIRRLALETRCLDLAGSYLAAKGIAVDDAGVRAMAMAIAKAFQTAALDLQALAHGSFGTMGASRSVQAIPSAIKSEPLSSADLVNGWKLEKRPVAKTKYVFQRVLGEFMNFLGHDDIRRITAEDISKWKAVLLGKGLAAKTIRDSKLAPVRALLQWAVDNSKLPANPAARLGITLKLKAGEWSLAGRETVLLVGSSTLFGVGLPADRGLAHALRQRVPGRDFLNAGVYSYGPPQVLSTVQSLCPRLQPKLIVYVLDYKSTRRDFLLPRHVPTASTTETRIAPSWRLEALRALLSTYGLHPAQLRERLIGLEKLSNEYLARYQVTADKQLFPDEAIAEAADTIGQISEAAAGCGADLVLAPVPGPSEAFYGTKEPAIEALIGQLPSDVEVVDNRIGMQRGQRFHLGWIDYLNEDGVNGVAGRLAERLNK